MFLKNSYFMFLLENVFNKNTSFWKIVFCCVSVQHFEVFFYLTAWWRVLEKLNFKTIGKIVSTSHLIMLVIIFSMKKGENRKISYTAFPFCYIKCVYFCITQWKKYIFIEIFLFMIQFSHSPHNKNLWCTVLRSSVIIL